LLREAALEPNPEAGQGPDPPLQKLGSTGSRIIAEVFYQLLNADAESIRNEGKTWQPPRFNFESFGSVQRPVGLTSMANLLRFVNGT
jgi:hypothetical protein